MQWHICAIYDLKTATYAPPFYARHLAQAERWLASQIMDPNSDYNKFADDYQLHTLGLFNDTTGEHLTRTEDNGGNHVPSLIMTARQLKDALFKDGV